MPDTCPDVAEWVESQVKGSLDRLGIKPLYAVLLHRPAQLLEARGPQLFAALERLKVLGYTKKIGISIYDPSELDSLFSKMHFDLVQAPLNILDRRLVDSGWARRLKHIGTELHVRSTFLQGLLLMSSEKRPQKFSRWQSLWLEWDRWLSETGLSPLEACLRFALNIEALNSSVKFMPLLMASCLACPLGRKLSILSCLIPLFGQNYESCCACPGPYGFHPPTQ
jgi:hypothetical protein